MTARMIIAKLVAFLFVQILSVRLQKIHNVQVLLLVTGYKFVYFFGIILKRDFREHFCYCYLENIIVL